MLTIFFGRKENEYYGPSYFKANYDPEWLKDPFVQEMIKDVDSSEYIDGIVINSPVLGPISPERLSGGVQTLIMIYEKPELVFDATSCGQNCAKWLLKIGNKKDVTVALEYLMEFDGLEPFEILIENTGDVVKEGNEYAFAALDLLHEVE